MVCCALPDTYGRPIPSGRDTMVQVPQHTCVLSGTLTSAQGFGPLASQGGLEGCACRAAEGSALPPHSWPWAASGSGSTWLPSLAGAQPSCAFPPAMSALAPPPSSHVPGFFLSTCVWS